MKEIGVLTQTVFHSPRGPIQLVVSQEGLKRSTLPGQEPVMAESCASETRLVQPYVHWLQGYFDGLFLPLPPLHPTGTIFQCAVWRTVSCIPPGETRSYQAVAEAAGYPRASRAVGTAMAKNPIPLFVPCHRVIRADGDVGHFGGGRKLKIWLLNHELNYENHLK